MSEETRRGGCATVVPRLLLGFGVIAALVALPRLDDGIADYAIYTAGFTGVFAIIIGVPLAFALGRVDQRIRRSRGRSPRKGWRYPAETVTVISAKSSTELFDRAIGTLSDMPGVSISASDRARGAIRARTGMSWLSAGERITVRTAEAELGRSSAVISSRPRIPTTLFDYGKNQENVEQIATALAGDEDVPA